MSKRPIIHADKTLRLDREQTKAAVGEGLKVAFSYRDGRRRRIMKGRLKVHGCDCCGIFASVQGATREIRFVSFTNLYSLFSPVVLGNEHY